MNISKLSCCNNYILSFSFKLYFLENDIPESFNILVKEMMALGIEVTLVEKEKKRTFRK